MLSHRKVRGHRSYETAPLELAGVQPRFSSVTHSGGWMLAVMKN